MGAQKDDSEGGGELPDHTRAEGIFKEFQIEGISEINPHLPRLAEEDYFPAHV